MRASFNAVSISLLAGLAVLSSGCAMFRTSVQDKDVDNLPAYDASYGAQDLRTLSQEIVNDIASSSFIKDQKGNPVMIIYGVQPRTTTFVDTQALTDRIRTSLIQTTPIRFVNENRRQELLNEQGYQAANATPDTQTAIGKQLGAKFMLTGSLVEITKQTGRQARVSKSKLVYYQLTMDITDLETGIISWSTQKEFARNERQPLIGW